MAGYGGRMNVDDDCRNLWAGSRFCMIYGRGDKARIQGENVGVTGEDYGRTAHDE